MSPTIRENILGVKVDMPLSWRLETMNVIPRLTKNLPKSRQCSRGKTESDSFAHLSNVDAASIASTHMKTHTGDKPHVCRAAVCGRRFATSSNLARHMRLHGPLPLMRCPRDGCSRSFLSDVQLAKHLKQHDAPQTHACKVAGCTKVFSTTGNLNRHLKKHYTSNKREELVQSALASWQVPDGHGADVNTDGVMILVTPAPIDKPCDEAWSPETLEILGHMLLS